MLRDRNPRLDIILKEQLYAGKHELTGRVEITGTGQLLIYLDGYGHAGNPAAALELYEGRPRILVWDPVKGEVDEVVSIQPDPEAAPCSFCGGKGWDIYNGNEIQRCDTCCRYESDEDAVEAVETALGTKARQPGCGQRLPEEG